jgi:hypothetical protein
VAPGSLGPGMLRSLGEIERLARQPLLIEKGRMEPEAIAPVSEEHGALTWRDDSGRVTAVCRFVDGAPEVTLPGLGTIRARGPLRPRVDAALAPSRRAASLRDAHRRFALPMILQAYGVELLHASAIRSARGVIAFCGASGAGKSTTAQLMTRRGYVPWSDDSLALSPIGGDWRSVGLPFRVRLREDAARALAGCPTRRTIAGGGVAPLAAIYVLRRVTETSAASVEIVRLPRAEAFKAVLPHASCFSLVDPVRNLLMIDRYLDLSSRVPVFLVGLRAGPDTWTSLPAALESHLARVETSGVRVPSAARRAGASGVGPTAPQRQAGQLSP